CTAHSPQRPRPSRWITCLFFLTCPWSRRCCVFFLNDPPPTEIYTLSLHDALPICTLTHVRRDAPRRPSRSVELLLAAAVAWTASDRKSTRLNSSHSQISYAVFCLKKKKPTRRRPAPRRAGHRSLPPPARPGERQTP